MKYILVILWFWLVLCLVLQKEFLLERVQAQTTGRTLLTGKTIDVLGFQCSVEFSANAKSDDEQDFKFVGQLNSLKDCCEALREDDQYNVFVYCPRGNNCFNQLNPSDEIPGKGCYLKYQDAVAQGNTPNYYTQGPGVDFISGYIPFQSRGVMDCTDAGTLQCDLDVLQLIFSRLNDEGKAFYSSWVGNNPCDGNWLHVECADVNAGNQRVIRFAFSRADYSRGLDGKWEREFLEKETLRTFGQPLPVEISKMRFLEGMEMGTNGFSGSIFPEISVLSNLKVFDIKENSGIIGSIPPEMSVLTNLVVMDISTNARMSGGLPVELSACNKMQFFRSSRIVNFSNNRLPPQYSTWKDLHFFESWESKLQGVLPVEYSVFDKMEDFQLNGNEISGPLPEQFSLWSAVNSLTVPSNLLEGPLPPQYSVFQSGALVWFDNNKFTGTLPVEYSSFTSLLVHNQDGNLCIQDPSIFASTNVNDLPQC